MRFRKLRIAWSVFCGLACVLLIVFWVRSYWTRDQLYVICSHSKFLWILSERGRFGLTLKPAERVPAPKGTLWLYTHDVSSGIHTGYPDQFGRMPNAWRFQIMRFLDHSSVHIPQWVGVALSATLVAIPWLIQFAWHFSLRTLLIALTVIAVGLGLFVYFTS